MSSARQSPFAFDEREQRTYGRIEDSSNRNLPLRGLTLYVEGDLDTKIATLFAGSLVAIHSVGGAENTGADGVRDRVVHEVIAHSDARGLIDRDLDVTLLPARFDRFLPRPHCEGEDCAFCDRDDCRRRLFERGLIVTHHTDMECELRRVPGLLENALLEDERARPSMVTILDRALHVALQIAQLRMYPSRRCADDFQASRHRGHYRRALSWDAMRGRAGVELNGFEELRTPDTDHFDLEELWRRVCADPSCRGHCTTSPCPFTLQPDFQKMRGIGVNALHPIRGHDFMNTLIAVIKSDVFDPHPCPDLREALNDRRVGIGDKTKRIENLIIQYLGRDQGRNARSLEGIWPLAADLAAM